MLDELIKKPNHFYWGGVVYCIASLALLLGTTYFFQGCSNYKSPSETFYACTTNVTQTVTQEELNQLLVEDDEITVDAQLEQPDGTVDSVVTINQCNSEKSDDDNAAGTIVVGQNGEAAQ